MKNLHSKAHTLPSSTSRHTSQNLSKSVLFPTQEEIQFFSPSLLKKIKHPTLNPTMTLKLTNDHGLQGGQEPLAITSSLAKARQTWLIQHLCCYQY